MGFPTHTEEWRYRVAVLERLDSIREAITALRLQKETPVQEVSPSPAVVATDAPRRGGRKRKVDVDASTNEADAPKRRRRNTGRD